MRRRIAAVSLAVFAGVAFAGDEPGFKKDKEIALPGAGGVDYLKVDSDSKRLYVAHSGKIDVIDTEKGECVGSVDGVDGAHGTAVVAAEKRGFATAGRKKKAVVFSLENLKVEKEVDTGEGPDAILFASSVGEVWTMNHRAGTITCIDAKSLEVKKTIEGVAQALEFAAEDPEKGIVYVNGEKESVLVSIDAKKHEILKKYPTAPGEEPAGLAIDAKNGLLFVGCGNKKLVVMEAASGKVVQSFDIGEHCDACAFDAETGNVFASCADGTTSILHVKDAKTFEGPKKLETAKGAKTCAVDPKTHKLYFATGPRRGEKSDAKVLIFAPEASKPDTAK